MPNSSELYSLSIRWVKILLLILAVLTFSTLFFLIGKDEQVSDIEFIQDDLQDLSGAAEIENPSITGKLSNDVYFDVRAHRAIPEGPSLENVRLHGISALIRRESDHDFIQMRSDAAHIEGDRSRLTLSGNVQLDGRSGFEAQSPSLTLNLVKRELTATKGITAATQMGRISAGKMTLTILNDNKPLDEARILFINKVKLIFHPNGKQTTE